MKRILLTSTALIGFAGYAAADVTWAADAELGYNEEVEGGFYLDGGLGVTATTAIDGGIEAGISMDVDIEFTDATGEDTDDSIGRTFGNANIAASDIVIFVTSDVASLYVGDTNTAAQEIWMGTTNMETDGFIEVGDVDDGNTVDGVLRTDLSFGGTQASISYFLTDNDDDLNGLEGLQLGVSSDLGGFTVGLVYQEETEMAFITDAPEDMPVSSDELIGVFAKTSFAGADVALAYSTNETTDASSTGIEVSYPVGPVTATVFYSLEDGAGDTDVDDNYGIALAYAANGVGVTAYFHDGNDEEFGLEASYDLGNGLTLYAGYIDNRNDVDEDTETYVAAEYGLSEAANLFVSYGEAGDGYDGDLDELGNAYEVNEGATIGVAFTF